MNTDKELLTADVQPRKEAFDIEESYFPVYINITLKNRKNIAGDADYHFRGILKEGIYDFKELTASIEAMHKQDVETVKSVIKETVFQEIRHLTAEKTKQQQREQERFVPLKPLKEWKCDTCGETIKFPEGTIQWKLVSTETNSTRSEGILYEKFKLTHDAEQCIERQSETDETVRFLAISDPKGAIGSLLLQLEERQCRYPEEVMELIKRLQVPYYEEGRFYIDKAFQSGLYPGKLENKYSKAYLHRIIGTYKGMELP